LRGTPVEVDCVDVVLELAVVVAIEVIDCSLIKVEWIPSVEATKRYVTPFAVIVICSPRDSDRVPVESGSGVVYIVWTVGLTSGSSTEVDVVWDIWTVGLTNGASAVDEYSGVVDDCGEFSLRDDPVSCEGDGEMLPESLTPYAISVIELVEDCLVRDK
jgi:hypothetical protein